MKLPAKLWASKSGLPLHTCTWACVHGSTHTPPRRSCTWNSERALSLLMPVLACCPRHWLEKVSRPGSSPSWGSGRGRPNPWPQAASTVWGSGCWGPCFLAAAAGPPPCSGWGWRSDSGFALTLTGRCYPGFSLSSGLWTSSLCRNADYIANGTLCPEDTWILLFLLWQLTLS